MTRSIAEADIGIIVLAAGSGKRFGADKRKAILDNNKTLLASTLECIPETFTRKILVLKQDDDELAANFHDDWQICRAGNPQSGMANSLGSGIALASHWQAALIALGDMPYIAPTTFAKLAKALQTNEIVVPTCQGERGNPVGFRSSFFGEIGKLEGDRGARLLLKKYAVLCREIETGDQGILRDVDHPDAIR